MFKRVSHRHKTGNERLSEEIGGELAELDISRRTLEVLVNMGNYETVEQVRLASDDELKAIPRIGEKSFYEIKGALNQPIMPPLGSPNPITERMNQLDGLYISPRTIYALAMSKYSSFEQVKMASDEELLSIRGLDMNALGELRCAICEFTILSIQSEPISQFLAGMDL